MNMAIDQSLEILPFAVTWQKHQFQHFSILGNILKTNNVLGDCRFHRRFNRRYRARLMDQKRNCDSMRI